MKQRILFAITTFLIFTSLIFVGSPIMANDNNPRIVKNINFGWRFHAGDINIPSSTTDTTISTEEKKNTTLSDSDIASVSFDDSSWQDIDLPHDFQIHQPWVAPAANERPDNSDAGANIRSRLSSRGFKEMGIGWYRKTFTPDSTWRNRQVLIDFEGIMLVGDVYCNGQYVGGTDYGYLGFDVDISELLRWGEPNIIAVKANTMNADNSRWYTGGGLYRDVNIIVKDASLHFTRHPLYITTPEVSREMSSVVLQAEIACLHKTQNIKVCTAILDASGDTVHTSTRLLPYSRRQKTNEYLVDSFAIVSPRLWSCDDPHLYTAVVSLLNADGTVADCTTESFGVRRIEYSPEYGLRLNGEKVLLKGVATHHTLGPLGAAVYPRAIEKRLQLLKDFGFNHIRTAHNPYSESFLDLCDRYGILVVDELYDKWLTKYAGGRAEWTTLWQHDIPEWIRRDRNHPSVIMWSLGNELQQYWELPYADWGVTPYRLQKTLLHRYDTTRPVTVAMHPRYRHHTTDSLPAPLAMETDIASYNYRYMYFPGDSRRFPWMMFYQSEANTSGMGPNYYEMDLERVVGLAYWGMIDYLGESHGWPAKGWTQGIFDISLEPKPMAYFLRSIFKEDEPLVHIAIVDSNDNTIWNGVRVGTMGLSDHWNRTEGSTLTIYTYTNADEVELIIGGKSMGSKTNNRHNPKTRNKIKWESVPYISGYAEAIARTDGKVVARHRIETTTEAVRLIAHGDNPHWKADGTDLQFVRVSAVDRRGRQVPVASANIHFNVDGAAEIIGVINGDMNSHELTVGDSRSLYNGTATVVLRSTRQPGEVILRATATPHNPTILNTDGERIPLNKTSSDIKTTAAPLKLKSATVKFRTE